MTNEQTLQVPETIPHIVDFIYWAIHEVGDLDDGQVKRNMCIEKVERFLKQELHLERQRVLKKAIGIIRSRDYGKTTEADEVIDLLKSLEEKN